MLFPEDKQTYIPNHSSSLHGGSSSPGGPQTPISVWKKWHDPLVGFPSGSEVKASACKAGDLGSIPGSGRSPGEGNGNPLQYSCLENPMDRGAWWVTVHGVAKSRTWLSDFTSLGILWAWMLEQEDISTLGFVQYKMRHKLIYRVSLWDQTKFTFCGILSRGGEQIRKWERISHMHDHRYSP